MAEAARAAHDYEGFHDLAWAAYRHGKSNDPEVMLLVARAQSLSGRPLDALVMLERIAKLGVATDASTSEDFARVRALPRWNEVAETLRAPTKDPAPTSKVPAPTFAAGAAPAGKPPATVPAPTAKPPAPTSAAAAATVGKPSPKAPLSFTTVFTPTAVAHDAVSQRYLIADRKARRIAVVDANTGQVATLVGAQGALGEIGGMAIDPREGDLWVVSTNENGPQLHKLQLISGRILASVPLSIEHPVAAMAYARGAGLVIADASGIIWRVRSNGKATKLAALEYVPRGLAADANGRLYVTGGTSRLARFRIGPPLRKNDTIDLDASIPADAPFVVIGNHIHFVVPSNGGYEIRSFDLK
jgi:hypothetical protein